MIHKTMFWERSGPILYESTLSIILDEINTVRVANSLPELTEQDFLNKILVKYTAAIAAENDAARAAQR